MIFIDTKDQGHLLTFVLDASESVFLSSSPLKLLGCLKPNYMWSLSWRREWDLGHMIKMTTLSIYGKKL